MIEFISVRYGFGNLLFYHIQYSVLSFQMKTAHKRRSWTKFKMDMETWSIYHWDFALTLYHFVGLFDSGNAFSLSSNVWRVTLTERMKWKNRHFFNECNLQHIDIGCMCDTTVLFHHLLWISYAFNSLRPLGICSGDDDDGGRLFLVVVVAVFIDIVQRIAYD